MDVQVLNIVCIYYLMGFAVSKLFKLKNWMTIKDAAKYLCVAFEDEVSESDVIQLGLEGELVISVDFIGGCYAREGRMVLPEEAKRINLPPVKGWEDCTAFSGIEVVDAEGVEKILEFNDKIVSIEGIYDLAMIGGEVGDLNRRFQILTDGPRVYSNSLNGVFVVNSDGDFYQLLGEIESGQNKSDSLAKEEVPRNKIKSEMDGFFPLGMLPVDCSFVVRMQGVNDLLSRISEGVDENKPVSESERNSMLKMIVAMAIYGYKYNPSSKKNQAVSEIASDILACGMSMDSDTVRKYLSNAVDRVLPRNFVKNI